MNTENELPIYTLPGGQKIKKNSVNNVQSCLLKPPWLVNTSPGGLHATCVLACAMRSLAIVITIVQSFFLSLFLSFSFFSPFFAFDPLWGNSQVLTNFNLLWISLPDSCELLRSARNTPRQLYVLYSVHYCLICRSVHIADQPTGKIFSDQWQDSLENRNWRLVWN